MPITYELTSPTPADLAERVADGGVIREERGRVYVDYYTGAVLEDRERNGYDDSDFYAVVWTGTACRQVDYASTRYAGGGFCKVDATPEVQAAAQAWAEEIAVARLLDVDRTQAEAPAKGKRVRVVRGRKVEHGVEGVLFYWQEQTFSPRFSSGYKQGPDAIRVGIATSDRRDSQGRYVDVVWTYARNVEVVDPSQYQTPVEQLRQRVAGCSPSAALYVPMPGWARL